MLHQFFKGLNVRAVGSGGGFRKSWSQILVTVTQIRWRSQLIETLEPHLKNLVKQHAEITDKLSSTGGEMPPASKMRELSKQLSKLSPIVHLTNQIEQKQKEIQQLNDLISESSGELWKIAEEEKRQAISDKKELEDNLLTSLVPRGDDDENNAILELRAGTGGKEASLFTSEMFVMYQRFAASKKWKFEILNMSKSDQGGIKEAAVSVSGSGVYGIMKFETGVHRVQRIPLTETMGRIHTSTMTVAVLAQPEEVDVVIDPKDLKIDTYRSSGAGGQHVNTTDSAVRITHIPTGIAVACQEERSQIKNKSRALQVLRARLYDLERKKVDSERAEARRKQIGGGERSEKIRTYNFPQGRVTDHRIGMTMQGLELFLDGGDKLDELIWALQSQHEAEALQELTSQFTTGTGEKQRR
ncbi:peptide chain release factor 1-like isoform X1 [Acropora palmata]|uniref:peptide chain release factor 1-like isoform X1 n=1 Tax=Acropora palmata TaxID=6131 RepID=UPI003DA120F6